MAAPTIQVFDNMTQAKADSIREATEQRAKAHAASEAQRLLEESLKQIATAICTPRVPAFTPAPKMREPVVHFGIAPEDAARLDALIAHAAKRAEQCKITLRGNEKLWELAFIAAHGNRHRIGRTPVATYHGQTIWPLHGRDDAVHGHIVITPGQGVTGVKVFDSFGCVMFTLGLPMCDGERWSRFTRGFERVAKVKPEIFAL
jgi:hypothetical protein